MAVKEGLAKGIHQSTLWGDDNVLYLDHCDGHMRIYTFVKILELLALKVCTFLKITGHIKNFKGVSYTINLCDFVKKKKEKKRETGRQSWRDCLCSNPTTVTCELSAVIQSKPVHVGIPSLNGDHRSSSQGGCGQE